MTPTGRLSPKGPNMQGVNPRTDEVRMIRNALVFAAPAHSMLHLSSSGLGFANWHINRKRLSLVFTGTDLRMISWRNLI